MTAKYEMLDYIVESKVASRQIVSNSEVNFSNSINVVNDVEQIYLVGSGTSYHAALASKNYIEKHTGIRVTVMYAMQFYNDENIFDRKSVLIGISHAGRSNSTILAINKAKKYGIPTIAMSATKESPVMKSGDMSVIIDIGDEFVGPKTKGYIGSIVTLNMFGLLLSKKTGKLTEEEYNAEVNNMLEVTDSIPDIFESSMNWYDSIKMELINSRRIIVMGYGNCLSATLEGTLKISEAVRYSVIGYEMEEFMHGIYHGIDENTYMFYLSQPDEDAHRSAKLRDYFAKERKNHNYMITSIKENANHNDFLYNFKNYDCLQSLEYVIPLQVIARRLSKDLGIDSNISSDPDFHKKMESYSY